MLRPVYWQEACAHLTKHDKVMGALIAAYPTGMLGTRGEALTTLVRSVVGQQISVKAAASIWARFEAVLDGHVTAAGILALSDEQMRGCGFSGSKVRYVRGIAQGFADGTVHPGLWDGMSDDAVIGELVKLPGIGRWTAEMFLMFFLMRPDVLAVDDIGLVKGFKQAYGHDYADFDDVRVAMAGPHLKLWQRRMQEAGERWRPYRSVASWYLWRLLDPEEVAY
ncbi:MAG: DNA-3-methyladenine glycosylase 2 family protein [Rubrivivax sp.]|nr:MAG: DNA-3-methyladenine glycosylase 2 family protein [Rubrivivax sp.]